MLHLFGFFWCPRQRRGPLPYRLPRAAQNRPKSRGGPARLASLPPPAGAGPPPAPPRASAVGVTGGNF